MSKSDPEPPNDVLSAIEKICEERGAKVGVSPAYYQWFVRMNDEAMTELIRLLVLERADDINHLLFEKRGKDSDLLSMVQTWLRLVARGYLQFNAGGDLLFYKPVGPEPTTEECHGVKARIDSASNLIMETIINVVKEQRTERQ